MQNKKTYMVEVTTTVTIRSRDDRYNYNDIYTQSHKDEAECTQSAVMKSAAIGMLAAQFEHASNLIGQINPELAEKNEEVPLPVPPPVAPPEPPARITPHESNQF